MSVEEQKIFLDTAYGTSNYNQFAFLWQTGLRTGEMIGLRWSDIDFEEGVIHIARSMEYRHSTGEWRIGPPKSKSGYRDIPITQECRRILLAQKEMLLGHSSINITMNLYVHVTEDEKKKEVEKNRKMLNVV